MTTPDTADILAVLRAELAELEAPDPVFAARWESWRYLSASEKGVLTAETWERNDGRSGLRNTIAYFERKAAREEAEAEAERDYNAAAAATLAREGGQS